MSWTVMLRPRRTGGGVELRRSSKLSVSSCGVIAIGVKLYARWRGGVIGGGTECSSRRPCRPSGNTPLVGVNIRLWLSGLSRRMVIGWLTAALLTDWAGDDVWLRTKSSSLALESPSASLEKEQANELTLGDAPSSLCSTSTPKTGFVE